MGGTREGGLKTEATVKKLYGQDFYKTIGRMGGQVRAAKGFATNPELAKEAGRMGGAISKRSYNKEPKALVGFPLQYEAIDYDE
jgi:general stress protein YciG